jgi:hypothetical protein
MYRSILSHFGLSHAATIALASLSFASVAHAQGPSAACKLLNLGEIESALGAKASKSPSGSSQSVPGMTVDECSIEIPGPSQHGIHLVSLSLVSNLPQDADQLVRMRNGGTAREGQWKGPGARLEQKTVGSAICIMSGRPNVPGHSTCTIPRGKGYVELDVTGSVQELIPLDTVAALLQKSVSRM